MNSRVQTSRLEIWGTTLGDKPRCVMWDNLVKEFKFNSLLHDNDQYGQGYLEKQQCLLRKVYFPPKLWSWNKCLAPIITSDVIEAYTIEGCILSKTIHISMCVIQFSMMTPLSSEKREYEWCLFAEADDKHQNFDVPEISFDSPYSEMQFLKQLLVVDLGITPDLLSYVFEYLVEQPEIHLRIFYFLHPYLYSFKLHVEINTEISEKFTLKTWIRH